MKGCSAVCEAPELWRVLCDEHPTQTLCGPVALRNASSFWDLGQGAGVALLTRMPTAIDTNSVGGTGSPTTVLRKYLVTLIQMLTWIGTTAAPFGYCWG